MCQVIKIRDTGPPASSLTAFMTAAARPNAVTMLSILEKPMVRAQLSVASKGSSTAAQVGSFSFRIR